MLVLLGTPLLDVTFHIGVRPVAPVSQDAGLSRPGWHFRLGCYVLRASPKLTLAYNPVDFILYLVDFSLVDVARDFTLLLRYVSGIGLCGV